MKNFGIENQTKSVSDENIFKSILPFFDEKKKTLAGSGNRSLSAVSLEFHFSFFHIQALHGQNLAIGLSSFIHLLIL